MELISMGYTKENILWCDRECGTHYVTNIWDIETIREKAKKLGWKITNTEDICSNCRKKEESTE